MRIIFCSDPLNVRAPDYVYESEVIAATHASLAYDLISFELLVDEHNAEAAVKRVQPTDQTELAIYRGWMLTPEAYRRLYDQLLKKGLRLINSPQAYRHCHHLPESYAVIQGFTPKTVWLSAENGFTRAQIAQILEPFGDQPLLLKDYVKSRKHDWNEACFIPAANDVEAVERVVRRFLELQGADLAGGLVFREFVDLEPLATHPISGMPLSQEYRLFFLDGELLQLFEYWPEGSYTEMNVPLEKFRDLAKAVSSRFFTMDIARQRNGEWIIVELGDAQVAGLPDGNHADAFYRALAQASATLSG